MPARGTAAQLHRRRAAGRSRAALLFCDRLEAAGVRVARGVFRARMAVELVNDGPVTIFLD
jgi:D-Tyr-tRNAtyr deacylase